MAYFPYSVFSPASNTTLFIHGICDASSRLSLSSKGMGLCGGTIEQTGFVDLKNRVLTMAGGEFCANASRAFGALLDCFSSGHGASRHYEISVSGLDSTVMVEVTGACPQWEASVEFSCRDFAAAHFSPRECLVEMPGISHLLLETDDFPSMSDISGLASALAEIRGLSRKAHGVVWWRKNGDMAEIRPYVTVPEAGTAMLESACGSASLALAAIYGRDGLGVLQPCGEILEAAVKNGVARVGGSVKCLDIGKKMWLEGTP